MLLQRFLERSAGNAPDSVALVAGSERLTYVELDRQCNAWARSLVAAGVSRGDRVIVFMENGADAVRAIFSILKSGAVFSVVPSSIKPGRLRYILDNCRARAVVTEPRKIETLDEAMAGGSHPELVAVAGGRPEELPGSTRTTICLDPSAGRGPEGDAPPRNACIDVDLAALVYTSGSTGNPKGVMLTHLNMVSAATSISTYLGILPTDIILDVLPLSFDYGLYQLFLAFRAGGTVVLESSFVYTHAILSKIARERVTGFPIVPTLAAILVQLDLSKYDLSSLRFVTNTGAALPPDHILALRRAFPHVEIFSMYGLTECKRVSYLPPDQIDRRPGSVGKAMPNVEVYIVDEEGRRLEPGSVGELVVRGSNVMPGYWELPDETAQKLRPGPLPGERVLYTGDLFTMDDEGYLYFVGRRDEMFKCRGELVSPKEVENVLHALEGVAEAAVVGVADPILGRAVKAFVVLREGAAVTKQDVLVHCARHLEDHKVPKHVEFLGSFSRTSSGKIDKKALAGREA